MDRENDSRFSGQITREPAASVIQDLFPQANDLDVINAEGEGVIPLRLTAADVNAAILGLNIDKATGFSGWSNRLLKHLYLHADDRGQLAENYAAFFNKQLKGELSAHMRKCLAPIRLCLIPKTKNPSDLKFRPIGIVETFPSPRARYPQQSRQRDREPNYTTATGRRCLRRRRDRGDDGRNAPRNERDTTTGGARVRHDEPGRKQRLQQYSPMPHSRRTALTLPWAHSVLQTHLRS